MGGCISAYDSTRDRPLPAIGGLANSGGKQEVRRNAALLQKADKAIVARKIELKRQGSVTGAFGSAQRSRVGEKRRPSVISLLPDIMDGPPGCEEDGGDGGGRGAGEPPPAALAAEGGRGGPPPAAPSAGGSKAASAAALAAALAAIAAVDGLPLPLPAASVAPLRVQGPPPAPPPAEDEPPAFYYGENGTPYGDHGSEGDEAAPFSWSKGGRAPEKQRSFRSASSRSSSFAGATSLAAAAAAAAIAADAGGAEAAAAAAARARDAREPRKFGPSHASSYSSGRRGRGGRNLGGPEPGAVGGSWTGSSGEHIVPFTDDSAGAGDGAGALVYDAGASLTDPPGADPAGGGAAFHSPGPRHGSFLHASGGTRLGTGRDSIHGSLPPAALSRSGSMSYSGSGGLAGGGGGSAGDGGGGGLEGDDSGDVFPASGAVASPGDPVGRRFSRTRSISMNAGSGGAAGFGPALRRTSSFSAQAAASGVTVGEEGFRTIQLTGGRVYVEDAEGNVRRASYAPINPHIDPQYMERLRNDRSRQNTMGPMKMKM